MGVRTIREWLVLSSLLLTGTGLVFFVFFSLAPALGFPLEYRQSLRVLEIIFPVFAGYLGSTTLFVFKVEQGGERGLEKDRSSLAGLLVLGPIIVFGLALIAVAAAFGKTNGQSAPRGSGMTPDQLAASVSGILALLSVTRNIAASYLFSRRTRVQAPGNSAAQ